MERNETQPYTFGADEQNILGILSAFENELMKSKDPNKNELQSIKYYEKFYIKGIKEFELLGIFVTEENDSQRNKNINVYYKDPSNKIFSIDSKGNIEINPEWKKLLGYIDIDKCTDIEDMKNKDLKGRSEKDVPEKIREKLENKKDEENEPKENEEEKENPEEQIQKDIGKDEDLQISYYREITDNDFGRQMGMNLNKYEEIGLAYSKSKDAFILVAEKDGHFQEVEGFEPAQPTYKTVISIDEKGESVKKEVPHALMKTNDPEKELSITIGQYGYIQVGTIDRLPCDARVKRQVGEQGETRKGETVEKLNKTIEQEGENGLHKWVHNQKEEHEEMEKEETRKGDITEEVSNSNNNEECIPGTNTTWTEFAFACGYRGEGNIEHAREVFENAKNNPENQGKTNEEIKDEIIEEKEGYRQRN